MAAVAPIIKAKPQELLIAMTIVFLLNALAIIFFPIIGGYLEMTNFQFGAWSALAIHDTSSVIGSALTYSNESAQVAATLKLGRTIWIIPLILITNWVINRQAETTKFPRFILFFILAIVLNTALNFNDQVLDVLLKIASQLFLMLGLFCIGTQFNVQELKSISWQAINSSVTSLDDGYTISLLACYVLLIHSYNSEYKILIISKEKISIISYDLCE